MYRLILPAILFLATAFSGCSGASLEGVAPSTQTSARTSDSSGPQLWGLWDVEWNPSQDTFEAVPMRSAMFTANVIKFINGSSSNLIIKVNSIDHEPTWVDFDLDIGFKHPFPGLDIFTGFDVMGVFMGQGSAQYPGPEAFPVAGPNDQQLLNPDGYTRRFNATEFTGAGQIMPLQGFYPGKKGTPDYVPTAVLNPFIYFADGLDADDVDTSAFLAQNAPSRGCFKAGSVNYRNFLVRMPNDLKKFQYAIIANWEPNINHPNPPNTIDDFPPSANAQEAIAISVVDLSDAYYVNETTYGGDIAINITPWDWSATCSDVMAEYSIKLYSSAWTGPYDVYMTPIAQAEHQYTFNAKLPAETLTANGPLPVWIEVDYPDYDFSSPVGVPNDAAGQLAEYFKTEVNVLDHGPTIPSDKFIYGMADSNFFNYCDSGDNKILFTNMLNLPTSEPYASNKKVMLYKGHASNYSDYFQPFQAFVESLGYEYVFVGPEPYVPLDTTGVKLLLIGVFYGKGGEYYSPEEIQTIKDFVNGGGVCIIITEFNMCYPEGGIDTVTQLLLDLKVDFTSPIDGDYHTDPFTDILPDPITVGVSTFVGACTGRFEVFGDGVSLISGIDSNGTGIYYTSVCKSPLG
jgi:hypothetical protein